MHSQVKTPTDAPPVPGYTIRKSDKAKRVCLRVHPRTQEIELVVPRRVSIAYAMEFAATQTAWIEKQRAKKSDMIALHAHDVKQLKKDARRVLTDLVMEKVRLLPQSPQRPVSDTKGINARQWNFFQMLDNRLRSKDEDMVWDNKTIKIRIGDPKTRWGSCHPDGRISLSWRLMLAPDIARDYVVAHEVAHLIHNNHGRRFWELCKKLSVDFEGGHGWMKEHGQSLQAYLIPNSQDNSPE